MDYKKELKTKQEIEDFVRGCTFFGTGGGGTPESGIESLESELENGSTIGWVDISEVPDDAVIVTPFLMGSIAPKTEEVLEKMKFLGLNEKVRTEKEELADAIKEVGNYTKKSIDFVIPIELGGANTPGPLAAAVSLDGINCVDADWVGRAIPEITQTTPYIFEKPMWPLSIVDSWGNKAIIDEACNYFMAERIGKMVSAAAFGLVGMAGFVMSGKDLQEIGIPNTLTECYEVGRIIRESRENGKDPIKAVIDYLNGWLLFTGEVVKKETEDKEGYYWGTTHLKGLGKHENENFKIWFKNENHITWKNDEPYVTSPDMIVTINLETGEPYANSSLEEGEKIAVIGVEKRKEFDNERGIDILGPKHFGFDIDHIPIKKLVE